MSIFSRFTKKKEDVKDFPTQTTFNTNDMTAIDEEVNDDGICTETNKTDSGE